MRVVASSPGAPYTYGMDMEKRKVFRVHRRDMLREVQGILVVGDAREMKEVEEESIALTVTSPPYWNAIDYHVHARDPEQNFRKRTYAEGFEDYETYLAWLSGIFQEVFRVTRPGGYLAIVVGTVLHRGTLYPVPFDIVARLVREGWEFTQDIIWHKVTAGVKRAGVFIQHPYPGYYRPNIMNEYILVFRKPGPPIYKRVHGEQKERSRVRIDEIFVQDVANNVWHIAPVPPGVLDHPAPFPEEIPYRLIQLYSYPGDWVLDPFLGSGQTAKVALALGRHVIGYDIVERYVRYARSRMDEPLKIRPLQLVPRFVKVPLGAARGYLPRSRNGGKTRHGAGLRGKKGAPAPGQKKAGT